VSQPTVVQKTHAGSVHNAFLPFVLVALGIVIVLGWNASQGWRQYRLASQVRGQQQTVLQQAAATETRLQVLLSELVTLARTNPQAKTIVEKYQIRFSAPAAAPAAAPASAAR
jgi:hypothetical protein